MRINSSTDARALPAVHEVTKRGEGEQHVSDHGQHSELALHLKARHVYIPSEKKERSGAEERKTKQKNTPRHKLSPKSMKRLVKLRS